jgi:hypothetical protein
MVVPVEEPRTRIAAWLVSERASGTKVPPERYPELGRAVGGHEAFLPVESIVSEFKGNVTVSETPAKTRHQYMQRLMGQIGYRRGVGTVPLQPWRAAAKIGVAHGNGTANPRHRPRQ